MADAWTEKFNEFSTELENSLDTYQEYAASTAIYPNSANVMYPILGLLGEAGELSNKYKKVIRDGNLIDREAYAKELGDVLWYLSQTANDLGISLGYIATQNLLKLKDRADRGVLGGSGDSR